VGLQKAAAAQPKKRKADEIESAEAPAKKSKPIAQADEEDGEEEEEFDEENPEDEEDEQEQEDDEPAVKTKIIKGSESKNEATEAATEDLDDED
jgi:hypothetical protein